LWKRRFFIVLKEPQGIAVFEDDPYGIEYTAKALKPRAFIDFKTVTAVSPKRNRCFNIHTPGRIWRLRCKTPDERPQWMNIVIASCKLQGAVADSTDIEIDHDHVSLDD